MKLNALYLIQHLLDDSSGNQDISALIFHHLHFGKLARDKRRMKNLERRFLYQSLSEDERRLRRNCMNREGLPDPKMSPFEKVYASKSDQNMITLTGLDYASFKKLLKEFAPLYNGTTPHTKDFSVVKKQSKCGKPRKLNAAACLGLALAWTRTRGSTFPLQCLFGITAPTVSIYVRYSRRLLDIILSRDPDAAISFPSHEEIEKFKDDISARYPHIKDAVFSMDGLKLKIEKSPDPFEENAHYNGWHHTHWVVNVLVFAPDGKIVCCGYNYPGCTHDSKVAHMSGIYEKLMRCHNETGAKTVVDSAFRVSGDYKVLFYRSGRISFSSNDNLGPIINREATSYRQASEWSMQSLQGSMPRMKDTLKWENNGERKLILKVFFLLHNYRVANVGVNQTNTVFQRNIGRNAEVLVGLEGRSRASYISKAVKEMKKMEK